MSPTVDPSFSPPPPETVVKSPDGILWARVDSANAGVHLRADFSAVVPQPVKVRFYRGDGSAVRSGDVAWAPDGLAHAYDHEAAPGETNAYFAMPLGLDGEQSGDVSDSLGVTLPDLGTVRDCWLKSPANPALSMRVWVENPPIIQRPARVTRTPVPGARLGLTSWDRREGLTVPSLVVVTETADEARRIEELLDSGVLLLQTRSNYDFPAFYCVPGDLDEQRVGRMDNRTTRWTFDLYQSRRPATLGAPLIVPGVSWELVASQYASWDGLSTVVPSWEALLGW